MVTSMDNINKPMTIKDFSFRVRYITPFPEEIHGMTILKNDVINIFINADLNDQDKKVSLIHEILHVVNDDFSKKDVREIEAACHKEAEILLNLIDSKYEDEITVLKPGTQE